MKEGVPPKRLRSLDIHGSNHFSMQNTFTPSFVMTYGGPYYATTYVPLLIYELAFDFFDFGMAAAALIITYLLLLMLIAGVLNIVRGWLDA